MQELPGRNHESVVKGGCAGVERLLRIKVIEVRDEAVKPGIEADAEIPVHREEIWGRSLPNLREGRSSQSRSW